MWCGGGRQLCTACSTVVYARYVRAGVLHVFDRHGARVAESPLTSRTVATGIDWDSTGGVREIGPAQCAGLGFGA